MVRARSFTFFVAALWAFGIAACSSDGEPTDSGVRDAADGDAALADSGTADTGGSDPGMDGGVVEDAGPVDSGECPEGYRGPGCAQCALGYQDGNGDGVCSLACDATGINEPNCGQGTCFIDAATDMRACRCEPGHVGPSCATCDTGWIDPDGDGICELGCNTDCGTHGQCVLQGGNEVCQCEAGRTGALCDMCTPGYVLVSGNCELNLPDEMNLVLWLDASSANSLGLDTSGNVATWEDRRRGSGLELSASAPSRPAYRANVMNGRPVVRFDGSNDVLRLDSFGGLGGADYTIFVVVDMFNDNPVGVLSLSSLENGYAIALDRSAPDAFQFRHRIPLTPADEDSVMVSGVPANRPTVLAVRRTTSGLFRFIRMWARADGQMTPVQADDAVLSAADLGGTLRFELGNGAPENLLGDVAELLIYDGFIEDAAVVEVTDYLSAKWGIQ
ncbi:hypothetical protein L6R52_07065 [Myxococcota bacterium]|nr:hypothetical protein [Myxococcota bacterium]